MENSPSIFKYSVTPGIIMGITLVLVTVILYILDVDPLEAKWISVLYWLIMALFYYFAQKNYRDKYNNGFLTLSEGIKIGVTMAVIASLFTAAYSLIFIKFLEPDFMQEALLKAEENMIEQNPNMTQEQIDMGLSLAEKFMNPAISIPLEIVGKAVSGLILSLITGLFVKRANAPV